MEENIITEIEDVEDKIKEALGKNAKTWTAVYEQMARVQEGHLYEGRFSSYTKWLEDTASRYGVAKSTMWAWNKAGKAYCEYAKRQRSAGRPVVAVTDITVSPDNLCLVDKIAGKDCVCADQLMEQTVRGALRKGELSQMWKDTKAERERNHQRVRRTNGNDELDDAPVEVSKDERLRTEIKFAIKRSSAWLGEYRRKDDSPEQHGVYQVCEDLQIHRDDQDFSNPYVFDMVVLETISTARTESIAVHVIDIRTNAEMRTDGYLKTRWEAYGDFFWLVVPEEFIKSAEYTADDADHGCGETWGILSVSDIGDIHVVRKARYKHGKYTDKIVHKVLIDKLDCGRRS